MLATVRAIGLYAWRALELLIPLVGALARQHQVTRAQVHLEQLEAQNAWLTSELRRTFDEAISLRRRLRIAIEDRDKWHQAWKRCRSGLPAADMGEPVPLDWRSPYGDENEEEGTTDGE